MVRRAIWAASEGHTEAYRRWMDYKVRARGAKDAVGGFDLGIGALQVAYLRRSGLQPDDRLLDIGCGSLRAGRFLIDYLEAGNYTGMDINPRVIEAGKELVGEETLARRDPTLLVNEDLRFEELEGTFDRLLAQSVFTHLPPEKIRECFEHVPRVMDTDSTFHFTYADAEERSSDPDNVTAFQHTREQLETMAEDAGLQLSFADRTSYPHPRGQRMVDARLAAPRTRVEPARRPSPILETPETKTA